MGRIPKLVKEKALAQTTSPSEEIDDLSSTTDPSAKVTEKSTTILDSAHASIVDLRIPSLDEHLSTDRMFRNSYNVQNDIQTATTMLFSGGNYTVSKNVSPDETQSNWHDDDPRIVHLTQRALTHYTAMHDVEFSSDVIERMKGIVDKISHPETTSELDYQQSSFIRYLRWKMVDLTNKYNGRTRQLIERMNIMINLGVS